LGHHLEHPACRIVGFISKVRAVSRHALPPPPPGCNPPHTDFAESSALSVKPAKPSNRTPPTAPVNKRGAARLAAVQALYQMDVAGSGVLETAAEYENFRLGKEIDGEQYLAADAQWFRGILAGVVEHQRELDPLIHAALAGGWPLSRLDSTLRAILRAGAFEMLHRRDVPAAVIITEYVEIAAAFYAEDEPRIVNAVLDRIGKAQRTAAG
jgi:transcription antitermination protein NusB